ncbi:MAG: 16S rRNA (guanine(527)-N(7))-methyltransferase RsmG [Bdellovibrionales bacterium]|nr:16S rRNA (guanine(527)-N(7))-methyltransferase RsmG [Bdellovibrionales bacterium]
MKIDSDINDLSEFIPEASPEHLDLFFKFFEVLCKFNLTVNLVSPESIKNAGKRHFADSYQGLRLFLDQAPANEIIYDFGSGNGFPGVIAAIMKPESQFVLVERDRRKAEFLRHLSFELGLKNINIHEGNAHQLRDSVVKFGMSRAMAPIPKFLLELRNCTGSGGVVYLFKGEHWTTEFSNIPPQIFDLWEVDLFGSYTLPGDVIERYIIRCVRS